MTIEAVAPAATGGFLTIADSRGENDSTLPITAIPSRIDPEQPRNASTFIRPADG